MYVVISLYYHSPNKLPACEIYARPLRINFWVNLEYVNNITLLLITVFYDE